MACILSRSRSFDLPNASLTETALTFDDTGVATMLLRSDPDAAYIGQAKPPYTAGS